MKFIQRAALFLFFFSINFEVWDPLHSGGFFSISKLMGLVYLIVMIPLILKFSTPREFKPYLMPIVLFFVVLTLVSIFNINTDHVNFIDMTIFQNIILFYILLNHEYLDNLVLEKAMLGFALGSIVLAILFSLGVGLEYDPVSDRATIFGDNENNIGIRMSIALIIIPLMLIQNRLNLGKGRYLFLLGIPLVFQLMIASASRVAFIAFVLSFITFIILFRTNSMLVKTLISLIGVVSLIYIWQVLLRSEEITERIMQTIREGDVSQRDLLIKEFIPIMEINPFFGIGKTGYELITLKLFNRVISPHNVILEILCLTGITGLIIYFVFLYRIAATSYKLFKVKNLLIPLLLLIPVFGLFLSGQLLQLKIGWAIFAYIGANSIYLTDEDTS